MRVLFFGWLWQRRFVHTSLLAWSVCALVYAGDITPGPELADFLSSLERKSPSSVDEAIPFLKEYFGSNQTYAHSSKSNQAPHRALLFSQTAGLIVGLDPVSNTLEVVEDREGKVHPYTITINSGKALARPANGCASCHGEPFAYIWKYYSRGKTAWPEFLGGYDDDKTRTTSEEWEKVFSHKRFKLLATGSRSSFPYYEGRTPFSINTDAERLLKNMPNTRLSFGVVPRATRQVFVKISESDPKLYRKLRPLLMVALFERCELPDWVVSKVDELFSSLMKGSEGAWGQQPVSPDIWGYRLKQLNRERTVLKILQILGSAPDQILLREPLESTNVRERHTQVLASYNEWPFEGSPVKAPMGEGSSVGSRLAWHVLSDMVKDGDIPKSLMPEEKAYSNKSENKDEGFDLSQWDSISKSVDLNPGRRQMNPEFCTMLLKLGLEPTDKNYDYLHRTLPSNVRSHFGASE